MRHVMRQGANEMGRRGAISSYGSLCGSKSALSSVQHGNIPPPPSLPLNSPPSGAHFRLRELGRLRPAPAAELVSRGREGVVGEKQYALLTSLFRFSRVWKRETSCLNTHSHQGSNN
ncbi:hypothetical protein FKM82_030503 [Ascaphus truei]